MHKVRFPFNLSKGKNETAESVVEISPDSFVGNYKSVNIVNLRFMSVYDEERTGVSQTAFTIAAGQMLGGIDSIRNSDIQNYAAIHLGNGFNKELGSLDDLPHVIEISIEGLTKRRDNVTFKRAKIMENQTTNNLKEQLTENNSTIQSMLVYTTSLVWDGIANAFMGTISCDMNNIGSFNVKDRGYGDVFRMKTKMYNFRGLAMDHIPAVEMGIVFK